MMDDDGIPVVSNTVKTHLTLSCFPLTATMANINQYVYMIIIVVILITCDVILCNIFTV